MERVTKNKFSANEKQIAELLDQNEKWKYSVAEIAEEINFLQLFLDADIFDNTKPDLKKNIQDFKNELKTLKTDNLEFIREIHNHRNDIQGMIECEDISCEVFYHEEHMKLGKQIDKFRNIFKSFKLGVFSETGPFLKKRKK